MAKKFFYNRVYNTKKTIINAIIIGVCIIGIIVCFIVVSSFEGESHNTENGNLSIKNESTVEIYQEFTKEIFFSKIENVNLDDVEVNYPLDYDISKAGKYEVTLVINDKNYPVILNVVDTTKPELNVKNLSIDNGKTYTANDFVTSCSDNSQEKCKISFYNGKDEEGNAVDYSKYTDEGKYQVKIAAEDSSGNQMVKETTLIIGKPKQENVTPVTCKYGNGGYDKNKYLVAIDVTTNNCAVSLALYKDESITKELNKLLDTETTSIKKDVEALKLTGTLTLNRKVAAVVNTTGDGIVGYEI